jgi:hypothetical protein
MPGWQVIENAQGQRHVIPSDDHHPHHARSDCWCGPTEDTEASTEDNPSSVWVHHAADGREANE